MRELERATGHAVRAMYLYGGMTDMVADDGDAALETYHDPNLLGDRDWAANELYRKQPPQRQPCTIRAISYAMWDNRQAGQMLVWMCETT